jgi:exonuclease III
LQDGQLEKQKETMRMQEEGKMKETDSSADTTVHLLWHGNIQCLRHKVGLIEGSSRVDAPCVIGLSEHWLREEEVDSVCMDNYILVDAFCRVKAKNGGVMMFAKEGAHVKPFVQVKALSTEKSFEAVAVSLDIQADKFNIGVIYRSPTGDFKVFLSKLLQMLDILTRNQARTIVCGDFNVNLNSDSQEKQKLVDLFLTFGMHREIYENTRITAKTGTCIDNIFSNIDRKGTMAKVMSLGISDHSFQSFDISVKGDHKPVPDRYRRIWSSKNKEYFKHWLADTDWNKCIRADTVEQKFDEFMILFNGALKKAFPLRKYARSTNVAKSKNDWYTEELSLLAVEVDKAYQISTVSDSLNARHKSLRRRYKNAIKLAKRLAIEREIQKAENKQKAAWEVAHRHSNSKKRDKSRNLIVLENDTGIVKSSSDVADTFREYFARAADDLSKCNKGQGPTAHQAMPSKTNKVLFLAPISTKEYEAIMREVSKKSSAGIDNIPCNIIRGCESVLQIPIIHIINASFEQGVFPSSLKLAKVIPILKKGEATKVENYRQISILSVFAKILEKAFHIRLLSFLNKYELINTVQHGFLKTRSTTTAMVAYVQNILQSLNRHEGTIGIFYDFSRAFDTVNISLLLAKLDTLGVRGIASQWIKSYLTDRKQSVRIANDGIEAQSTAIDLNVGIPQGGTLSPLLFILFTNDIIDHATQGKLTLFADDTSQLVSGADARNLASKAAGQLQNWAECNNLILNQKKSVLIQFRSNPKPFITSPLVILAGKSIPVQPDTTFLGVVIDDQLTWTKHITKTCSKVATGCFLLKKIMEVSTLNTAKMLYFACIESRLRYGIILWGQATNVNRLFKLQKRAVRIIANASANPCATVWVKDTCRDLFRSLRILTLTSLYILEAILFVVGNGALNIHSDMHSYETRNKDNFLLSKPKLNVYKKGVVYAGCKFYNRLPKQLQLKGETGFKTKLKNFLTDRAYYSVEDFLKN